MLSHYPLYDSHLQSLAGSQLRSPGTTCLAAPRVGPVFTRQHVFFGCQSICQSGLDQKPRLTPEQTGEKHTIHPVVDDSGITLQEGKVCPPAACGRLTALTPVGVRTWT